MRIVTDIDPRFILAEPDGPHVGCQYDEAEALVAELRRCADDIQVNVIDRTPEPRKQGRRAS